MRKDFHSDSDRKASPIPNDYDEDPGRFRGGQRAVGQHWLVSDVHEGVADRLIQDKHTPVLGLGCGEGRLMRQLHQRGTEAVGLDSSPSMLAAGFGPRLRGEAVHLPFGNGSIGSVAALYMLYHLPDPVRAIAESLRVLRQGGIFVASTPSRYDDPELETVLPRSARMTFDAESGPALVEGIFANVEVEPWDVAGVHLPDRNAVALYLYHHNALPRGEARRAAMDVSTPLTLTKRGALIWAHKGP